MAEETRKQRQVNESYRNALQAFIERRRWPEDSGKSRKMKNIERETSSIPGVPHVPACEFFEIGWVAGTEDKYLELIFAEWQNTRVSIRREAHPQCRDAIKNDLEILTEIRHPNVMLLMATTLTDEHGLISVFESVDCTLFNYIHEQGERICIQGMAKCAANLADALRHAHSRGFIHTAISPHCVFLASGGVVKLGGWELAISFKNPKLETDYEDTLRSEIIRWQAPEIFYGFTPTKETDVYGLSLLIWEMCTVEIPWDGCNKSEIERQFISRKKGIAIEFYEFPALLNNLLEAGLQVESSKRNLDMNRMRRFLQRLEMQYEEDEPVYINIRTNDPPNPFPKGRGRRKSMKLKRVFREKLTVSPSEINYRKESRDFAEKDSVKNKYSINIQKDSTKSSEVDKVRIEDSWVEQDFQDARTNIKKLKEMIMNKRENFFYGNDQTEAISKPRKTVLVQTKNKNYEPHKPASHKTSFEPKYSKSPGDYDPSYLKSSCQCQRANIQNLREDKILNSDSQNLFESSFWRKEKLICISKMRKTEEDRNILGGDVNDNVDTYKCGSQMESPKSNETYTLDENNENKTDTQESVMLSDSMENSRNKSLRVLKDALDRATEIIHSTSANRENPRQSPSSYESNQNLETDSQTLFENICKLKSNNGEEITGIERADKTFAVNETKSEVKGTGKFDRQPESEMKPQTPGSNITLITLNDRQKNCTSCFQNALSRRRSLPAALGHIKSINNSVLGKLPIRRNDMPDSTVEDLYIDDEFGDGLNVNMILLNEEELMEDFLPDISEL